MDVQGSTVYSHAWSHFAHRVADPHSSPGRYSQKWLFQRLVMSLAAQPGGGRWESETGAEDSRGASPARMSVTLSHLLLIVKVSCSSLNFYPASRVSPRGT